jgi:mannose-6-phosphate isomerase-like protein (cupin superfamily)
MSLPIIQRVVTGHDREGRAVVTSNGPLPNTAELKGIPGLVFHEIWNTTETPAVIGNDDDPTVGALKLEPPANGSRIRFVDFPPDQSIARNSETFKDGFAHIGAVSASTSRTNSPHPLMHRTKTVDYGIVIAGEIHLVLDASEVPLKAGDVVVQRGTNHAWANRSNHPCRMLFILIDGQYEPSVEKALKKFTQI